MILLTGGLGFIGSHMAAALIAAKKEFMILDNLSNSNLNTLDQLAKLNGSPVPFVQADIRNKSALTQIFLQQNITSVIHFAALKSVSISLQQPIEYYENNISGLLNLLSVMQASNCRQFVFSSSAAVYGQPKCVPIQETADTNPLTPYGQSKLFGEQMLKDLYASTIDWKIITLRYFNPVGAHPSGLIGETPNGKPANLMPCLFEVIAAKQDKLSIYGNDYATFDGTCVRDYIHVMDLVEGHLAALDYIETAAQPIYQCLNLGRGKGVSVLEMWRALSNEINFEIPYEIQERRTGDPSELYADVQRAKKILGWQAKRDLNQMCQDAVRFYRAHT